MDILRNIGDVIIIVLMCVIIYKEINQYGAITRFIDATFKSDRKIFETLAKLFRMIEAYQKVMKDMDKRQTAIEQRNAKLTSELYQFKKQFNNGR